MSDLTVGTAFLAISPSFQNFGDEVNAKATEVGESAGKLFADAWEEATSGLGAGLGPSDADSARQGDSAGSAFADAFKARIEAALADLPDAKIGADATEADATIEDIRARLEALSNQRIGIDISDAEALAAVDEIKADLDELSAKSPSINVGTSGVDSAIAELEALKVEADELGSKSPTIRVNVSGVEESTTELTALEGASGGASGGLSSLASNASSSAEGMSALGPAIAVLVTALVPLAGLAAGALATLPALLAGAGTGIGVLGLGFSGITGAISDYSSQQGKAAQSTASTAAAAVSAAETQRNAANSVQSAQEALTNASVNGDRQIQQAQEALGNAQVSAANSVHSAQEQLVSSEQSLTEAEFSEQQAQESLTQARVDATNALINYNDQLADGALNAQQDQINLEQAQAALAAGPTAGSGPGAQAQLVLNVQKAQQAIQDQGDQYAQLQQQAAAANAAGVEGSTQVVNAQHQVDQATQGVATAQQAVADNTTALAQAQASAIQKVSDAQQAVSVAQESAAQSTADASRALNNALADQSDALQKVADGSAGAGAEVNQFAADMAKLSPAGQQFVDYFTGTVLPEFDTFKDSVQQALIPGFLVGLQAMQPLFTALQPLFIGVAQGIGAFAAQLGTFLGSQTGVADFFTIFEDGIGFFNKISPAFLNLFEAIAGAAVKASPLLTTMGSDVAGFINAIAKWIAGGGFEKFLEWLQKNGPDLVSDIKNIAKFFGDLIVAATPTGEVFLDIASAFSKVFNWIQKIDPLFSVFAIAIAAGAALGILLLPVISLMGVIVAGVLGLVLAVTLLFTHWSDVWGWIRDATNDVWHSIDNDVFHPIEDFFTITIPHALSVASGAFTTGFQAIHDIVNTIWHAIDNDVLHPMEDFFTQSIPNALQTMSNFFTNIWDTIWGTVKQYAGYVQNTISYVLVLIENAWDSTWGTIKGGFDSIWNTIWKSAVAGVNAVIGVINTIIKGVDVVINLLPGNIPLIPTITPIGGSSGDLFSSDNSFFSPSVGGNGQATHDGGMVGAPGGMRISGPLSSDERMIRALVGEEVLTADDPRHANNLGGAFVNNSGIFHDGGIIGDAWDGLTGFFSNVAHDALDDIGSAIALTATPAIDAAEAGVGAVTSPFGKFGQVMAGMVDWLGDHVKSVLSTLGSAVSAKQASSKSGGINVPAGPATGDLLTMFQDILQAIGAPINGNTIQDLTAWQQQEGGWFGDPDQFNPFNTTQPAGGSFGTNSVGVQSYPTFAAGLAATVATLENGLYPGILSALRGSAPLGAFEAAVDSSPWGTVFHEGGLVSGPPDREILAILKGGETVLTAPQRSAVRDLGNASNTAKSGPAVVIENQNIYDPVDSQQVSRDIAFRVGTI